MSLPVGLGDLVMLIKGLSKLAKVLKNEASESFQRCAKTYKRFAEMAKMINKLINDSADLQRNEFFTNSRRDIEQMLRSYFERIQKFKPYLGRGHVRRGLSRAIAKFRWVLHTDMLEELRRDLEFRFAMLNPFVAALSDNVRIRILDGRPTVPGNMPRGNCFVLEDARRTSWRLYFSDIPDWNRFQGLLTEQFFPEQDPGHNVIKSSNYMLRNASTSQDILPSSASVKNLRDVINPDDRVEMNVIVPYEDEDTEICPGCHTEREGSLSSPELSCRNCGLLVRFYDTFDDQPDPLTQIAMDDLRNSGLRRFVKDFVEDPNVTSLFAPGTSDQELKKRLRPELFADEEHHDYMFWGFLSVQREFIQHFRRIALCTPRWPPLEEHPSSKIAKRNLRATMTGIQRWLDNLRQGPALAFEIVGKAIGSRIGGRTKHIEDLLESLLCQYRSKTGSRRLSSRIIHVLDIYSQCGQESRYPFRPSVLRLRCLLWIIYQVLTLEANILDACSTALRMYGRLGYRCMRYQEADLPTQAISLLFVPHILVHRAIFDVIGDAVSLFQTRPPPPPVLGALFCVLRDSRGLCFDYLFDNSLQNYDLGLPLSSAYTGGALACDRLRSSWEMANRRCLESVMSSGGNDFIMASAIQSLCDWGISE